MRTTSKTDNTGKKKNLFLSGVLVLTIANILVKGIGMVLKIPLFNLLGDTGMGYYNAAYKIYTWFYMISTAGLPTAVSILISESRSLGNFRKTEAIYKTTLRMFLIIGAVGTALMLVFSELFASGAMKMDNARLCIICIAPTLFFICISSAFRGYFQGYQNMFPTAVSQVIEALGKLVIGMVLASFILNRLSGTMGENDVLARASAGGIGGVTIGVFLGMLFLILYKKFRFRAQAFDADLPHLPDSEQKAGKTSRIIKNLTMLAIPITISASIMSLTDMIDVMLISRRLQSAGYSLGWLSNFDAGGISEAISSGKEFIEDWATAVYGNYSTLCVTMFNLPPVLIYPISYSIIPVISAAIAAKNKEKAHLVMNSSMRVAALISLPCALGMSVLARPILSLVFGNKIFKIDQYELGLRSADIAAPLLSILAVAIFFIGIISVTNAILQAAKFEKLPIISMLAGAGVKLVLSYILVGNRDINIYGTPISTLACYLTIMILNFFFVAKYVKLIPGFGRIILRPFAASVLCALTALGAFKLLGTALPDKLATLGAIVCAGVVYIVAVFLFRAIEADDIMLLPKGEKICALCRKLKLVK